MSVWVRIKVIASVMSMVTVSLVLSLGFVLDYV
jgi:hypothetical protein